MSKLIKMTEQQGASFLATETGPKFEALEHQGWNGATIEESGVFVFMFDIEKDAVEFPLHASDQVWMGYVVSGSGTLYAGCANEEKTGQVHYQAGDFISFAANTLHGWENDCQPSKLMFIRQA
ncbi:cupin domain-containing protein [Catenovulum sp. 2E275]|uniref:cupin domain-containing protein n=1 Tax=Catenovulum sp. 2E275 TaxID=2980497 RepID=UPI0021CEA527|nr:cupin domain-containing protein [Catenovulum sp. 2E275]MCU4675629.1 cupin domain-containing protein [Catenovulum sp. 2E275]